jgi:hypothetical protein
MLGGVDLMTMPALQEWLTAIIAQQIARAMTYPNAVDLSFTSNDVRQHAQEAQWPQGVATATVQQVCSELPPAVCYVGIVDTGVVIAQQVARAAMYPNAVYLSFTSNNVRQHAKAAQWPQGLTTATVQQVRPF